jgi:hypothetical protein
MAIKSSILSTVNGFITAIITQAKVRSALSTLLDNFYPTPIYDTHSTTNVFTKTDTDFTYNFKVTKIGRSVHLSGLLRNVTASSIGNQNIVTITLSEYYPYSFATDQIIQAHSSSGAIVNLAITGTTIYIVGVCPPNVDFYFNGNYSTLN